MSNGEKERKITEGDRPRISSRKLEIPRGTFHAKSGTIRHKPQGPDKHRRGGKNTQKNYTKEIFMTQITKML